MEYLSSLLGDDTEKEKELTFESIIEILKYLLITDADILRLTQRTISLLFNKVRENILCNYIDKVSWLKATYGMQNGSFMNLSYMEEIPMNLFLVMYEIHKEAVESVGKE